MVGTERLCGYQDIKILFLATCRRLLLRCFLLSPTMLVGLKWPGDISVSNPGYAIGIERVQSERVENLECLSQQNKLNAT